MSSSTATEVRLLILPSSSRVMTTSSAAPGGSDSDINIQALRLKRLFNTSIPVPLWSLGQGTRPSIIPSDGSCDGATHTFTVQCSITCGRRCTTGKGSELVLPSPFVGHDVVSVDVQVDPNILFTRRGNPVSYQVDPDKDSIRFISVGGTDLPISVIPPGGKVFRCPSAIFTKQSASNRFHEYTAVRPEMRRQAGLEMREVVSTLHGTLTLTLVPLEHEAGEERQPDR